MSAGHPGQVSHRGIVRAEAGQDGGAPIRAWRLVGAAGLTYSRHRDPAGDEIERKTLFTTSQSPAPAR
jgi:hypothetical protein